ncbi:MAG: PA1571 family protein [Pseudomonas sp.]
MSDTNELEKTMSVHAQQTQGALERVVLHPAHCVGGWLIDAQGREVAITEQMIQQACAALETGTLQTSSEKRKHSFSRG